MDQAGYLHAAWVSQYVSGYLGLQPQCVLRMAARHPLSSHCMIIMILALTSHQRAGSRLASPGARVRTRAT